MTLKKKHSIFISSTYDDLKPERQAVIDAALDNNIIPVGMEQFHSAPAGQWDVIKKMINECDGYLIIIAGRYGSIDETVGISYTEKEYDYAKSKKLPVWVLIREKSAITADKMDDSDAKHSKQEKQQLLETFTEKVKNDGNTVAFFKDIKDLKYEAAQAFIKSTDYFPEDSGWVRYSDIKDDKSKDLLMAEDSCNTGSFDDAINNASLYLIGDTLDSLGKCDSEMGELFLSIPKYLDEKENKDEHSFLVTKGLKFTYNKSLREVIYNEKKRIGTSIEVIIAAYAFRDSLSLLLDIVKYYKEDSNFTIDIILNSRYSFVKSTEEVASIITSSEGFSLNKSKLNSYIYTKFGFIFSVMVDTIRRRMANFIGCKVSIAFDVKTVTSDGIIELIERLIEIGVIEKSLFNP